MNIYATALSVRTVCSTCGKILNEICSWEEPVPVSDLEVLAHEAIDAAGFANGKCPRCLAVDTFGSPDAGWGSSTQPEE